uniref:Serine racemase n=1 Tax=Pyramimonas obovata TaxID=1411642 RepID=A0A7S0RMM5_9CHLO|mmetsp:Transcript_38296/g.83310  ORF Transcript_38296/g.83310 Transcript_38296/m.83310 type:complete len:342 (+) Transcript_38296:208-1233(+)|eukprot:CAMPEP_0118923148 /NCGR_PEP_ID=MMETSP1169-20130426/1785_1 /TAXON_ID=36882 /ORGANISM="Pyramimonas obovata, Strain CCMP722" /LENGTH=341 /DNA_ID=CAMNT_0006864095 /DNA_START=144 /DNA_END=1169 /DNA_ORIENTATION=-
MARAAYAASLELIQAAAKRIAPYAKVTPVLTCSTLDALAARKLHFKCEVFQKGGAFKFRGACNAVFSLPEADAKKGVVTHSSGNHAGALALAAKTRGIPSYIVVPWGAPECKLAAIKTYGGAITQCEATVPAREAAAAKIQEETGAALVPPYNDGAVMAGQGTISLELLQQVPHLDAIVVPISGGGMISGIALAAKGINPKVKVFAAEPVGRDGCGADVAASKAAGRLVADMAPPNTIADGLRAKMGDLTWPVVRDLVDGVIPVEDRQIVAAMRLIYERMKVVVEPSGAAGLAAVLSPHFKDDPALAECKNVGIVLCGGNLDLGALFEAYDRVLQETPQGQ